MDERLTAAWSRLPEYLGQHVLLSACALVLGFALATPLAITAARAPAVRWPLLSAAGLVQTIPSLALLALFYPLLVALSALSGQVLGCGFPALGFLPSVMALTLYAMLPVLRNTVAGLEGVPADVREAALGVGMTSKQALFKVELPIAAPVIMAGVRTSAVWVIGAATLSTPVGQPSLGNYIFTGLQTENWVFVLFGCAASAGLALVCDQLLGLVEAGLVRRDRRRMAAGAMGLALGTAAALFPAAAVAAHPDYVVGGKTFTEQLILSRLMQDRLNAEGLHVESRTGLGSAVILRALREGDIDAYVDYTGTIWTNAMGRRDNPGRSAVLAGVTNWLRSHDGVRVLGPLGFENTYALAMRGGDARRLGVHSVADLARHAPGLVIGGDYEFFGRPEWQTLRRTYHLRFKDERQYQSSFMYRALASRQVDVVSAFSSDGRIAAGDLTVLDDPEGAVPPYDAVILIAPGRAGDRRLLAALQPLVNSVSAQAMRRANARVDLEGGTPAGAADKLSTWISARSHPAAAAAPLGAHG